MQTLRNTIETNDEVKSTSQSVKMFEGEMERNTVTTMQTREYAEQNLVVAIQVNAGVRQLLTSSHKNAAMNIDLVHLSKSVLIELDKMQTKNDKGKERNMKSGASRPVNFDRLKNLLMNDAVGGVFEKLKDAELSYVARLFDWIDADPVCERVSNNDESLLYISGTSGMGKTTLSFRIFRSLGKRFSMEPTTCVAWFRSTKNTLKCDRLATCFAAVPSRPPRKINHIAPELSKRFKMTQTSKVTKTHTSSSSNQCTLKDPVGA